MFLSNRNKLSRNYNHVITDKHTQGQEEILSTWLLSLQPSTVAFVIS